MKGDSKHDFRFTFILPKEPPAHWYLEELFKGVRNKDSPFLLYGTAKQKKLLGCYKGYVTTLSNGDKLINLYFVDNDMAYEDSLLKVTEELDVLNVGWVIFK
jgi:hypothetical protein